MLRGTITTLNATQREALGVYRDRWCEFGRSTAAADRDAAELAIADMYRAARLRPPHVVWCGSPLSLALTRALLLADGDGDWPTATLPETVWQSAHAAVETTRQLAHPQLGRAVGANVWDGSRETRIRSVSWSAVMREVSPDVAEELRAQLLERVRFGTWETIWRDMGLAVWNELCRLAELRYPKSAAQATRAVEALWQHLTWELISPHAQLGTLAALEFLRDACSAAIPTAYDASSRLAQSAGWALAYEHVCWLSERPSVLRLDGQGRLHCADGPALAFPDGWRLHCHAGTHPV
jgi:hypothetical protein